VGEFEVAIGASATFEGAAGISVTSEGMFLSPSNWSRENFANYVPSSQLA
jgi:hypothetical protein